MRTVKIIAWILAIYIIQTVFAGLIGIRGIVPDLLLGFSVIYSFHEQRYNSCTYIMLACGMLAGSCVGRSFPADVLVIGAASVAAHELSGRIRFVPKFVRTELMVAAAAVVLSAAEYFISYKALGANAAIRNILPYATYTLICSFIMYPLIVKTLFKKEEKQLLVV
ncbi:MAG: hypothetical protein J1G06_07695 [Oscillospiraceae bacterium]|nr:hypothetical protein [Oscillospiraceae bacterium]